MTRDPRDVLSQFRNGVTGPVWPVDVELASSPGITARNCSAEKIAAMPLDEAAVLNGCLGPSAMQSLVAAARRHLLEGHLAGIGIELGAGLGVLSAVIAESDSVEGILALEICPNFVDLVIPRVAEAVLGDRARVVVPTLGSFDAIDLDDSSLDFAIEMNSLHHADDLDAVLAECARVLKPDAPLVCFDRAQPDDMPDWLRERMLDRRYSDSWIAENGYPPGTSMTRRENGEHEIRLGEWREAFSRAGFRLARVVHFVPVVTSKLAAKGAASYLPPVLRSRLVRMPVPRGYVKAWVRTRRDPARDAVGDVVFAPMTTTGMLAYR